MNYKKTDTILEWAIVYYFKKEKDNRVAVIAKHFNVGTATVQRIINDYLKTKIRDKISV